MILFFFVVPNFSFSSDTCSRVAIINYQEVLVDTNSTQKGEGLRYYLEKDPVAKHCLDRYQGETKNRWVNATLGTIGTLLILTGILTNKSSTSTKSLIIGGSSIVAVNFLVAKTMDYKNEINLQQGIDEYNKRNIPRIYFNPFSEKKKRSNFLINFTKDF